jgi:25S rRNA (cytosine2278-C5)-methyltransferase
LSLFLVHDFLFSKSGIAAPFTHPLRQAVERHKARLQSELTRARLRRKCATAAALKTQLLSERPARSRAQPRWVRINTLRTSLQDQLASTFKGYKTDATLVEVTQASSNTPILALDHTIPDLVALPPDTNVTQTQAYQDGRVILQDKASCFPAAMLCGSAHDMSFVHDCLDGCAAPGNKTSHLAALLQDAGKSKRKIYACERDPARSKTLEAMMYKSGAKAVVVRPRCDFLTLDPNAANYGNVTHLLLDPSCSGSGIVGRQDIPLFTLPLDPRAETLGHTSGNNTSSKRKRDSEKETPSTESSDPSLEVEESRNGVIDKSRLQKLSNLQTRIVEHAMSFPAAVRITYSTCSIHTEENEEVVARVLASKAARDRGWRLLRRDEQLSGLRAWEHRGIAQSTDSKVNDALGMPNLDEEDGQACIRCHPGDENGTMGFFVCCFVRSGLPDDDHVIGNDDASEWEGFAD